jgi:hypothetical protein
MVVKLVSFCPDISSFLCNYSLLNNFPPPPTILCLLTFKHFMYLILFFNNKDAFSSFYTLP